MLYQNSLMPAFITEVPLPWLLITSDGNLLSAPSSHATVRRNDVCLALFTFLVCFQSRTLLCLCQGKDAKMDQEKSCAIPFFNSFFTQLRGIFVGTNPREEKLNSKWLIARGSLHTNVNAKTFRRTQWELCSVIFKFQFQETYRMVKVKMRENVLLGFCREEQRAATLKVSKNFKSLPKPNLFLQFPNPLLCFHISLTNLTNRKC